MPALQESRHVTGEPRESFGDLLSELAVHSAGLVQDEFTLARQEISEKLKLYKVALLLLIMGAVVGLVALMSLCTAFILWLGTHIAPWLAAMVAGGGLAAIAVVILLLARSEFGQLNLKPEKTIRSLEENKEWLKDIT